MFVLGPAVKVPVPEPNRVKILLDKSQVSTMSGLPSPLTSARAAVKRASEPAHAVDGMVVPALNVPFPAPKYTCRGNTR